jgi:hypothetical protein
VGVGQKPDAVSSVGRFDGTSWNNKRLDAIFERFEVFTYSVHNGIGFHCSVYCFALVIGFAFQVSNTRLEYHRGDSSNVFTKHPSGSDLSYSAEHFWPEVTVIVDSSTFSCIAEWLAGKSSCNDVDFAVVGAEVGLPDIFIVSSVWPVVAENGLTKRVVFYRENIDPAHKLGSQIEAANARKETCVSHHCCD